MKSLKEYIEESSRVSFKDEYSSLNKYIYEELQEQNINESILLMCLCGAIATHFAVRGLKKVRKVSKGFWDWATGETKLTTTAAESLNEEKKFDKNKIEPAMIESADILDKVIKCTKAEAKKKQGFYILDKLINDTPELKKINKAPYYPNYVIYMDAGSKENEDQRPTFYGVMGFSLKYWTAISKNSKDQKVQEAAKNYKKYINIFVCQTDPQYAKQGLFEVYLESMKNACKEAKMIGLTIKADNDKLVELFKSYGFKTIENLDGYMEISFKKNNENGTE